MPDASFNVVVEVKPFDIQYLSFSFNTEVHGETNKDAIRKAIKLVDLILEVLEEEGHLEK